ncbi:MAG: glycosyltransferase 87 family protein [Nitrososphaerales archaeon]
MKQDRDSIIIIAVISILLLLNLATFYVALPETSTVDFGCCTNHLVAKDFSAYYSATWLLYHNVSAIYSPGNVSSLGISPHPEPFKYLPSILLFVSPLLLFSYHDALIAFDVVQIALLLPIAYLLCALLRKRSIAVISLIMAVALLEPSPFPNWGFSVTYYWQWAEGQSKVLLLFILLLSFYLGRMNRPRISGIVFGLSFFDPRFALLAIPLFLACNKGRLLSATISAISSILVFDSPLFIPTVGTGFVSMVLRSGLSTPVYPYAYIPLLTIILLSIASWKEITGLFSSEELPVSQRR